MFPSFNARAVGLLDLDAARTIDLAAAAGFEGVDLLVRDLVEQGHVPAEVRKRMDDQGLKGGAWPLPVNWRGSEEAFERDMAALPGFAEAAAILGLRRTGTWVLPEVPERTQQSEVVSQVQRFHEDRLGRIAHCLAQHGSGLGIEVIGVERFRTGNGARFVASLGDLDRHLPAVWGIADNIGLLVDGFHLYAAGETLDDLARHFDRGRKAVWVHVADLPSRANGDRFQIEDNDRGLPGENGAIDSRALLQLLSDRGYDGPVTAEPMPACRSLAGRPADEIARLVKASLDRVWPT